MRFLIFQLGLLVALVGPTVAQNSWTIFGYPILTERGTPATTETSLIAVLSNPDGWDGKSITIDGWFRAGYGSASLFISSEYCVRQTLQYGVRIDYSALSEEMGPWYQSECTFGSVQGTFRALPRERPVFPPGVSDFQPIAPQPGVVEAKYLTLEPIDNAEQ